VWRPIALLARGLSRCELGVQSPVDDPLDFVHLVHRDSAHGCKSSSCSRPGVPVTPEPSEYHIRPPADESQKNGASSGTSPALLSPRSDQPLAQLFAALIREDDAGIVVRLRGQRSISSLEKPIAIPILDQRWDISDPAHWATQLALNFSQHPSGVVACRHRGA
jgi:hypothetical protein